MKCKRCESQGIDHDAFKKAHEEDLFLFTRDFVSDWVIEDFHLPVTEWFQSNLADNRPYHLILLPRGHLKTTVFTIGLPLWLITRNPEVRIKLAMSSLRLAKKKLRKIASIAQGSEFKHFWGDLVPDPAMHGISWKADEIEFLRKRQYEEASITAVGGGTLDTGGHYDVQILDDLVDGTAANSDLQMQSAIDHLEGTDGFWVSRKNPLLVVVGTLWPGGFYEEIMKDADFEQVVFGCYVDDRYRNFMAAQGYDTSALNDGDPVYVGHETKETLARSAKRFKNKFTHQMENLLTDDSLRRFRREDFVFYDWGDDKQKSIVVDGVYYPVSTMYRQMTIDPGGGSKDSDESAIVVTGWVRNIGHAFVLDVYHDNVTTNILIKKIMEMAEHWNVNVIRPEYAAMQIVIGDWLKEEMIRQDKHYAINPARHGRKSKADRLDGLQPWIANQQVHFRRDQPDIIQEGVGVIIAGGKIKGNFSPNMMDALAYHCALWNSSPDIEKNDDIPFMDEEDAMNIRRYTRYGLVCPSRVGGMRL